MTFLIGVVAVLMDLLCPERLLEFLNGDIIQDLEEFVVGQSVTSTQKDFGPASRAIQLTHCLSVVKQTVFP